MSDSPRPSSPSEQSSWSREGITIAISLIGAGASLNSWFPAFQVLGVVLIVAGLVVLVGVIWPSARSLMHGHLQTRARRLAASGALITLLVAAAVVGMRLFPHQSQGLHLNAVPSSETPTQFSLLDLLPEEDELPVDLVEKETGKRTGQYLARLRSSAAEELEQRMIEWEYDQNVYRDFERAEAATPTPHAMFLLEVSIHRLGSANGAAGALAWFADDRSELAGLPGVPVEQIGDEARAIAGEQEGEGPDQPATFREATVYFRKGGILVRVTAQSERANPMPVSIAVARLVASKMPG